MKKRWVLNKRGYFFLLDSILALGILVIGSILVFSSFIQVPLKDEPTILSEDAMSFFSNTKIKDVNNAYARVNGELWEQGLITNEENTLLQQVGEFYAENNLNIAEKFIVNITENIIPNQYAFEIRMNNQLLHPRNPSQSHLDSKESTEILIPSKKIVFGFLDEETGELFGPYSVEVLVWQS